jgi:hypothetical protein
MLDTWPWEALPSFCSTNDLLKVAKRPLKGDVILNGGLICAKDEILSEFLNIIVLRGQD